jgi:ferredoxin-type protein NapH
MKKIGLIVFVTAFLFFVLSLSMGKYIVSKDSVMKSLPNKAGLLFSTKGFDKIQGTEFGNQFVFVSELKKLLRESNSLILAQEGITEEDLSNLIFHANFDGNIEFSQKVINQAFPESTFLDSAKNKLIAANLNWLFGREIKDNKELSRLLIEKQGDINNSILASRGFEPSKFGEYLFPLTKHSTNGLVSTYPWWFFFFSLILASLGVLVHVLPDLKKYPGIKNDGIYKSSATNRGWIGVVVGSFLISFYVLLYWFPYYITTWIVMVEPLKKALSGGEASHWFLYGLMYTLAMLVMGVRMLIKYRHNKYQIFRTISVMFFQLGFAFLIPEILVKLNQPEFNFTTMWPLDYDFFFEWNLEKLQNSGGLGLFMLVWGIALFAIGVPIFVYFFGKRWYCSWVCGCGGLAETLGDPYRQLSNKTLKAWKVERWLIHSVLVFAVVMTGLVLYTYFSGHSEVLGFNSFQVRKTYGFLIGSVFSGVVGTGFYPLLGNRSWCRFGCPLAAYLGLVQKFKSRFRITTNGGQCISCGNCSTYCEMGIDVRAYAQKGQNIVRSSCVGCGICSAVCPRGVLKLENGPTDNRVDDLPIILGNDGIAKLNDQLK